MVEVDWVVDFITPTIKLVAIMFILFWFLYLFYWVFKRMFPDFRWWFKYSVLKKSYDEKLVEWCVNADGLNLPEVEVRKRFLIKGGYTPKSVEEVIYIYRKIEKQLKGGDANGQETRRSDKQVEETKIPEF